MKTKIAMLAALAALATGVYLTTQLWAQAPGAAAPGAQAPSSVKIGLVNLAGVLKGFNKFKMYNDEMEKIHLPFAKKEASWRENMKQWQDYAAASKSQAERDKAEDALKTLKRLIEDNAAEYQKEKGKKSDAQMVQMFKELEDGIKRYAQSNGYHMILQYSEPLTDVDKYAPPNIQRKLVGPGSAGSVGPLYVANGLDVSAEVISLLNSLHHVPTAAPAPGPGGGG